MSYPIRLSPLLDYRECDETNQLDAEVSYMNPPSSIEKKMEISDTINNVAYHQLEQT